MFILTKLLNLCTNRIYFDCSSREKYTENIVTKKKINQNTKKIIFSSFCTKIIYFRKISITNLIKFLSSIKKYVHNTKNNKIIKVRRANSRFKRF